MQVGGSEILLQTVAARPLSVVVIFVSSCRSKCLVLITFLHMCDFFFK